MKNIKGNEEVTIIKNKMFLTYSSSTNIEKIG